MTFLVVGLLAAEGTQAEVPLARQAELVYLLKADCGSCHGMSLKGGLGPPLTPAALASKSPDLLHNTILAGRPGTPMPPWAGILRPEEISWLVETLRKGIADGK